MNPHMVPMQEYQRVRLREALRLILEEDADPDRIEHVRIKWGSSIEETIDILDELETA